MNESEKSKNPYVAAILNIFIWGLGYLYNGKRKVLGVGLIVVEIIWHIPWLLLGVVAVFGFPYIYSSIAMIVLSIVLAYDAYKETKSLE